MAAFTELAVATNPVLVTPEMPKCATDLLRTMATPPMADGGSVEVFSSGGGWPLRVLTWSGTLTRWLTSSATTTTG